MANPEITARSNDQSDHGQPKMNWTDNVENPNPCLFFFFLYNAEIVRSTWKTDFRSFRPLFVPL
jgi:hypothetical protein